MLSEAFDTTQAHLQKLNAPCLGSENVWMKRDDLIHPVVSGNKWRKLKQYVEEAKSQNKSHLVTFGGAYSNHMIAVACAGAVLNMKTSCFIRGDELEKQSNHFLKLASLYGMNLIPVDREIFRSEKKSLFDQHFEGNPSAMMINEGGAGLAGTRGVAEVIFELAFVPNHIVHASATGTTAIGLKRGILTRPGFASIKLHSVAVLLNSQEQNASFEEHDHARGHRVITGYEFGGYAKTTPELIDFMKQFISETGILIDPVYTAKALYALKDKIQNGEIQKSDVVVFLHTGGMMGLFSEPMLELI